MGARRQSDAGVGFAVVIVVLLVVGLIIKYFWWIPVRNYFRTKPLQLSGLWDQQWQAESTSFSAEIDRHSNVVLKQIGAHCYGEFTSKRVKYCIFGRIMTEGQAFSRRVCLPFVPRLGSSSP